jgi:hypothetical protein
MKTLKISVVLLLAVLTLKISGQNLIGYNEKAIKQFMKDNQKNMIFQTFINNSTFKYLKYADNAESQTLLFFLTADSVCKSIRLVCDKSLKAQKIKEFDTMYKKTGDNTWTDTKNGKNYIIELKDEDYSFSVTILLKE